MRNTLKYCTLWLVLAIALAPATSIGAQKLNLLKVFTTAGLDKPLSELANSYTEKTGVKIEIISGTIVGKWLKRAQSSGDIVEALVIAQAGLERYMSHYDSLNTPPLDGDSLRVNVTGGYADVVAHVVRNPPGTTTGLLYIVRSRGRVIKPTHGADPQAVRLVAQFATWQAASMDVIGALTAINSLACATFRINSAIGTAPM